MYFRLNVRIIILRLLSILIASVIVGYIVGYTFEVVLLTCMVLLVWHYRHLFKLVNWLWQSKAIAPPQSSGIWGEIYNGLYRQIRQQRQKQKRLNERIRLFRDGAEALPDAALVLSKDLTIQWGNKKARKLLGVRWPEDIGQRVDNLVRAPEFSHYLNEEKFESPCVLASPVSGELQLEIRLMTYGSEHMLLLARDISQLHRLEEIRRDFVANVSHELKTPLTVVRGYVEMVQSTEHALDPHWNKAFSTIEDQVTRMDRLVEQLLHLSKVEMQITDDTLLQVDIPTLITKLVDEAKWLNQDKKHQITLDIESSDGILGKETDLKSACTNLLENAIAYTPAGGEIRVSWQKVGNKMIFSVKDNGVGIKAEHINRLTERFYRIDKSRSRHTGGTGLGLAIVKHVLHHHNAKLEISSVFGQGSEFSIVFDKNTAVVL